MLRLFCSAFLAGFACFAAHAADSAHSFTKLHVTDEFWAEGAHFGDFNKDGKQDLVYGPFWFEAPDFRKRHEYRPATATWKRKKSDGTEETLPGYEGALGVNNAYSDNFLTYTYDFNADGWIDIMIYGFPGKEVIWYENPKGAAGQWPAHTVLDVLDNESPGFVDVTGDGKPEILCCRNGFIGYAEADWSDTTKPWKFRAVSPKGNYERYTHGIGAGDVNGDGRIDVLEKDGWWEQPARIENDQVWTKHAFTFAPSACQMYAYDVNGDGRNDIITCVNAHSYGLVWWEQVKDGSEITFQKRVILNDTATPNAQGISFSQLHAIDLVDMDGDGLKDIVTGKRFYAHGPDGDPDPKGAAVLYWFKLTRPEKGKAEYTGHLIDNNSGVGTEVIAGFVTNPKYPDVVVGNKKGLFLLKHEPRAAAKE